MDGGLLTSADMLSREGASDSAKLSVPFCGRIGMNIGMSIGMIGMSIGMIGMSVELEHRFEHLHETGAHESQFSSFDLCMST
jgi:hypothetical protein